MPDLVLEISQAAADISLEGGCLRIRNGATTQLVALLDLNSVVLGHPGARITNSALSACAASGIIVVTVDQRFLPVSMLLPMTGHHVQPERFRAQIGATLPRRKRAWQEVVRSKVKGQASVLRTHRGSDHGLIGLSNCVNSGDTTNIEAQAARIYWKALFGPDFIRDADRGGANPLLNYGYAVLRAATARALVGSGLHCSFGIHHHNRYDAFCLADDMMEPFRPLIDHLVVRLITERGEVPPMDPDVKRGLVDVLGLRIPTHDGERAVPDVLARMAASLFGALSGQSQDLFLPAW